MKKLYAAAIALGILGTALIGTAPAQAASRSTSYVVSSALFCNANISGPGFTVTYTFTPTGPGTYGICTRTVTY